MPSAKQKKLHPTQLKRHGRHHRHSAQYVKVYWPYLPLLFITLLGSLLVTLGGHLGRPGVLSYATEMSSQGLLVATNDQRRVNDRQPLTINAELTSAAQTKAEDMASRNYWAHNTPDGQEPWVFIQNAGYAYLKAGENLAYGFSSSDTTVTGWMNSPGHRANLLDSSFKDVGFGFVNMPNYQGHGPETIVVAEYGDPLSVTGANQTAPTPPTTGANAPFTSSGATLNEKTTTISRLQSLTHGVLPTWSTFVVGLLGGVALTYLLIKHSLGLRKLILKGETLFLHHPYMDAVLMALVFVSIFLTQVTGVIR